MDIQFHKIDLGHGLVKVTLHEQECQNQINEKIKHYAKNVRIKGFRAGAVPEELVRNMYKPSILADVLHQMANQQLGEYCKKENISMLMEPLLVQEPSDTQLKEDQTFVFTFELPIIEPLNVELGKHISFTKYVVEPVDDALIDEFIQGLQLVHGHSTNMEKSSDVSVLHGSLQDPSFEKSLSLRMVIDHIPLGLRSAFLGLHVGDQIVLEKKVFETHFSALLGIPSNVFAYLKYKGNFPYNFTLHKIQETTPEELNASFFAKILGENGPDTLPDFKEALGRIMLFDKQTEANHFYYEQLQLMLLNYFHVSVSDTFLKKWLQAKNPKATEQEIDDYMDVHMNQVAWDIFLGQVSAKYELKVEQEEILEKAKHLCIERLKKKLTPEAFDKYSVDDIDRDTKVFLTQDQGKNYMQIHSALSKEKALQCIEENISIVEEKITLQAFDEKRYSNT